ncbi:MAG TPA: hypothetical protein VEK80_19360, partial [Kribbellaceae bacterium]|nr:hypothetical protein [Kribbellaceae bacterium]
GPFGDAELAAAAKAIGISADDLRSAIRSGQTIAQVAQAHNVAVSKVVDAMTAAIKDRIQTAVTSGRMTQAQADAAVAAAAELVRTGVDLEAFVTAAKHAPPLHVTPWDAAVEIASVVTPTPPGDAAGVRQATVSERPVVAVAGGPVFSFRYAETAELLTAAGAYVATFDPVRDESLPEATAALYLGGGFPEIHAEALSANAALRTQVATAVAGGLPVVAECAGLLYLCRDLDGHPMAGSVPASARMTPRLTLGYRTAVAATHGPLYDEGRRVRGHEFHRTTVTYDAGRAPAWHLPDGPEGVVTRNLLASYLHLHWTATPDVPARLVAAARRWTS